MKVKKPDFEKAINFGSKGMAKSSFDRILGIEKYFKYFLLRKEKDLFSLDETIRKIDSEKPDIIINAQAAMVGVVIR